jgi:aspartokinase
VFVDLHGVLVEMEQGAPATSQLKDRVLSFGARLSSEIVAAAFAHAGMKVAHAGVGVPSYWASARFSLIAPLLVVM